MTKILGESQATAGQMAAYLLSVNSMPKISMDVTELCQKFVDIASAEGVRGDALFAQSCKETGNFEFKGTVRPEQNNFAGLGTTDANTPGATFHNAETGILAQAQHAKAYATKSELNCPCVDPRYNLIVKYGKSGTAENWEDLGGKWAVPGYDTKKYSSLEKANLARDSYGYQIVNILNKILSMPKEKQEGNNALKKTVRYQTKNGAYSCGRQISPRGIILHSYGCAQPDPWVLVERWDISSASACVHAHCGKDEVIIALPCDEEKRKAVRGWHAGTGTRGSANNTHLSLEMTEPSTIKYIGGSNWIEIGDGTNTKAHVLATYKNAVQIFAEWCKFHGLNPLEDGVIISHSEAHKRGIASNHGDVEHIWNKFGLTMNQFRKDVKEAMTGVDTKVNIPAVTVTASQKINPLSGTVTVIYDGQDGLNIRTAPDYNAEVSEIADAGREFTVAGISEDEKWYNLSDGRFVSAVPAYVKFTATAEQKASTAGTGYYRVRKSWNNSASQIGAFKKKENAIAICQANGGYKVFDPSGNEVKFK